MLQHFFRTTTDHASKFPLYVQVGLVVALLFTIWLSNKVKYHPKALTIGIFLSAFHQIMIYGWYFGTGFNTLTEGLPLYHCRIAMVGIVITYFTKHVKAQQFFALLGFVGGIVALLLPEPDPFMFPHVTNFSFVLGHLFLMYNAGIILGRGISITIPDIIKFSLSMNLFVFLVNTVLKSNYSFLAHLPKSLSFLPIRGLLVPIVVTLILIVVLSAVRTAIIKSQKESLEELAQSYSEK